MSDIRPDTTQDSLRRRRRRRRKKRERDPFDLPGVRKIVLSPLVQKIIGCVAGNEVTAENPWKYVTKEVILDNIELHEESSEFLPIRNEIVVFPGKDILIGYIPDEGRSYDEFYICLTKEATNDVSVIIQKMKKEQEMRLYNTINKSVKPWISQGSEVEVDEAILKNNRPLFEVEIESQYPIYPTKPKFDTVKAEERRDGYMELKSVHSTIQNVCKKRIDANVQVAPQSQTAEAQTTCTYPSNMATQYDYSVQNTDELFESCKKSISDYATQNYDNISDFIRVNGTINLYSDDYNSMPGDPRYTKAMVVGEVKEYVSFLDVDLCKDKMISDACWHPLWTGTVAVSYVNSALSVYRQGPMTDDYVLNAIYEPNPVLIWSTNDVLKPKLILESPRPVLKLSFCKFNENILIGGCSNGQIIIWDIRKKLEKVETVELLTPAQQKYRNYLYSLMGWMKNIQNVSLVRLTALSDLSYSPKGPITGITWMSPFYEVSKSGNLTELPEHKQSLQFLTTSEDGTISLWDLLKKPILQPGGFKQRRLRRLKTKPAALMLETSPFRVLHLNLKPLFKIKLQDNEVQKKLLPITSVYTKFCNLTYVQKIPASRRITLTACEMDYCRFGFGEETKIPQHTLTERVKYRADFRRDNLVAIEPKIRIGTMKGDYVHLIWEGLDFDSGEVVNLVDGKALSMGRYHDGPVNTVSCSSIEEFTLTVGGKIFALWHKDLPNRPVIWRKNKYLYTTSNWNKFEPYSFMNKIINGDIETWILSVSSKAPINVLTYSSSFLTASAIHPINVKKVIYGAGDKQGTFRLYFLGEHITHGTTEDKMKGFQQFVTSEVARKNDFLAWQDSWSKKNASLIKLRDEEQKAKADKEEEARKKKAAEQSAEKASEKDETKGPQPGKYVEWVIEQRKLQEKERIRNTVISKKQLDTKELERRRKPLQKLDEENERKKRKQKQRLKEGDQIFKETVASLFPEIVKEKPLPPPDPYAGGDKIESSDDYSEYLNLASEAEEFVNTHPYIYQFNWKEVLKSGKRRKKTVNRDNMIPRKKDHSKNFSNVAMTDETVTAVFEDFSEHHHV